ncbi:ABC transporter permease, partial [Collinsella ihumii]|nr:ABC transporter permease [Collinsella ihumii]
MRSTFKATVIMLLRTPSALVWALAFPVLMATLFMFMFSSMRNDGSVDAVPVAVVADAAWDDSMFAEAVGA